jgi:hypothetical protein
MQGVKLMSVAFRKEARPVGGVVGAGVVDAAGGAAAIILAICGLAGVEPPMLAAIAALVVSGALLARAGMIASALSAADASSGLAMIGDFGGALTALFLAGVGGLALGILALLDVAPLALTAVAVIGFGGALLLSNGAGALMRNVPDGAQASEIAPAIAGLVALVLGVLALAQTGGFPLVLSALLILGAGVLISGGGLALMMQAVTLRRA